MISNVMSRRTIVSSYHLEPTSVEEILNSQDVFQIIDALYHQGSSQTDLEACRMLLKLSTQDQDDVGSNMIRMHELNDPLDVMVLVKPNRPSVSLHYWCKYGSRNISPLDLPENKPHLKEIMRYYYSLPEPEYWQFSLNRYRSMIENFGVHAVFDAVKMSELAVIIKGIEGNFSKITYAFTEDLYASITSQT